MNEESENERKEKLDGDNIVIIRQFLSNEECFQLIKRAEADGFKPSPYSGGGHGRTGREDARTNKFTVISDQNFANELWKRVKSFVPKDLSWLESNYFSSKGGIEWNPCGVVERLRFYKYEQGDSYPEHMDGTYKRTVVKNGETFIQQSFLTLLLYLNDDFDGGETRFFPSKQHCRFLRDVENKIPTVIVKPERGAALLNIHNILHEATAVDNSIKYVIRTDILFQKKADIHPKISKYQASEKPNSISEWEKIFEPSCKDYHD